MELAVAERSPASNRPVVAHRTRTRLLVGAIVATGAATALSMVSIPDVPQQLLAGALVSAITLPCLVIRYVPGRWVVVVAVCLALLPAAAGVAQRVSIADPGEAEIHDAVVLNDEAARMVLRGELPYGASYAEALPTVWHDLGVGEDGSLIRNPALDTYPYLPGSFLVVVPATAVADLVGLGWDGRILYLAGLALFVAVAARHDAPAPARAGLILGAAGIPTWYYLWWGSNDAIAVSLFLVGALLAQKHPRMAGVALAVAVSFKVVLAVPAVALAALVVRRGGWAALRAWWTLPVALGAATLPFFLADPGTFVDQTILFNLNRGSFRFPVLGIGLPAVAGGVFHGPVLTATVVVGGLVALVAPAVAVWRRPALSTALVAGGLSLLCVFLPATNFRPPYLVMVIALLAGGWLAWPAEGLERSPARRSLEPDPVAADA